MSVPRSVDGAESPCRHPSRERLIGLLMIIRQEWPGFQGGRPSIATSACPRSIPPKKRMVKATLLRTPPPMMHVDDAQRDPALLAEVERLYQLLQIEGRKAGYGSAGQARGEASPTYLALEAQIQEASWRYKQSPIRE